MSDARSVDAFVSPQLVALTDKARAALGDRASVPISRFPFKVGRESRAPGSLVQAAIAIERRLGIAPQLNDVYLLEPISPDGFYISREHFQLEYADDTVFLFDRNSACGTLVAGKRVGGDRSGGRTELRDGDVIVLGTPESPYQFRFEVNRVRSESAA